MTLEDLFKIFKEQDDVLTLFNVCSCLISVSESKHGWPEETEDAVYDLFAMCTKYLDDED